MRTILLSLALAFVGFFGYLILSELVTHGVHNLGDFVLSGASLLVLVLLSVGIVAALRNPPDE